MAIHPLQGTHCYPRGDEILFRMAPGPKHRRERWGGRDRHREPCHCRYPEGHEVAGEGARKKRGVNRS